jgi:hypothetical protein
MAIGNLKLDLKQSFKRIANGEETETTKEVNQYLTLFTFLKLAIIGAYLYFEARHHDITDYMQVNWLGWPKNVDDDRVTVKAKVK